MFTIKMLGSCTYLHTYNLVTTTQANRPSRITIKTCNLFTDKSGNAKI